MKPDHDGYYWIKVRYTGPSFNAFEWQIGMYCGREDYWGVMDYEGGLSSNESIIEIGTELIPPED